MLLPVIDADTCHAACDAKDRRFDGRFFVGVTSTGIYCRCICPARQVQRKNRTFWPSAAAAELAGFRPCLLCRPERAPGLSPIDASARLAAAAYARIEAGALEEHGLEALADELGITSRHLRRVVKAEYGTSPVQLAQTGRLLAARRLLCETPLSVTEIAYASGFRSLRRFNDTVKHRYGLPPSRLRGRHPSVRSDCLTLTLSPRGELHFSALLEFWRARSLQGIEVTGERSYTRVLRIGPTVGWLELGNGAHNTLTLTLCERLAPHLRQLVAMVRGAADLDVDVATIDAHLRQDDRFTDDVDDEPLVRVPGSLDGFETAMRAVLGQQVTVAGARTLTQRLVQRFGGDELPFTKPGLSHTFPEAARLADAGAAAIAAIGLPQRRAETLYCLAVAASEGKLPLQRGAIDAGRRALAAIPGIGPWTIEYVAMRALGDPDAYPASDAALVAALGRKGDTLEHLRPWRAYAAVRLWRRAAGKALRRTGE